jgi:hypothetical protein
MLNKQMAKVLQRQEAQEIFIRSVESRLDRHMSDCEPEEKTEPIIGHMSNTGAGHYTHTTATFIDTRIYDAKLEQLRAQTRESVDGLKLLLANLEQGQNKKNLSDQCTVDRLWRCEQQLAHLQTLLADHKHDDIDEKIRVPVKKAFEAPLQNY